MCARSRSKMTQEERGFYDEIRDFVRECYQGQARVNRQALGFVMTHFRLRLGSSLYAFSPITGGPERPNADRIV